MDAWKEIVFRDEESGKLYHELEGLLANMELKQADKSKYCGEMEESPFYRSIFCVKDQRVQKV